MRPWQNAWGARIGGAVAGVLLCAGAAAAQQATLSFKAGRVSVDARNVPLSRLLAEWQRVGRTTVVNGEKVTGAPVTLALVDVPEQVALEVLLRDVSGYLLVARADASASVSRFERILILPTSAAPPPAPARATVPTPAVRFIPDVAGDDETSNVDMEAEGPAPAPRRFPPQFAPDDLDGQTPAIRRFPPQFVPGTRRPAMGVEAAAPQNAQPATNTPSRANPFFVGPVPGAGRAGEIVVPAPVEADPD